VITLTDDFDKSDKQKEIDDFFAKFDKLSNDFDKSLNKSDQNNRAAEQEPVQNSSVTGEEPKISPDPKTGKTRLERLSESRPPSRLTSFEKSKSSKSDDFPQSASDSTAIDTAQKHSEEHMTKRKKKKKYTVNKKQLLKFILFTGLSIFLILGGIVVSVIVRTPPIDPDNIYSRLSENSTLYDDQGNVIDSILTSDGLRTNVSYSDLPQNLVDAFVAIEDKTFWKHHGFNFIRILGAIKEGIVTGDNISGTSTITQQLARNLYLAETKSDYSLTRKIKEAYYTVLLEQHLSKKQILEAYLNTIFLGYNTNGVQAASQAYFSKDVKDLTLVECAALASLPKAPDRFALVKRFESSKVANDNPNIIKKGDPYTLVYNDAVTARKNLVLKFMLQQGKITQSECDKATSADLKDSISPSKDTSDELSSYFADYVINSVIKDLMKEYNYSESDARQKIYNSGFQIYTTMNSNVQKIAEKEFTDSSNFPKVSGLDKDKSGNVLDSSGNILLYNHNYFFNSEGTFTISPDEYKKADDGKITLLRGKRLNFIKTEVQGKINYSVEFKDMYLVEDGVFYCIKGGVISVPQEYKTKDDEGNLIISGQFVKDHPDFFQFVKNGIAVGRSHYTLSQKIIQPQSAMVITDYKTGNIKAMVGGRNIEGRLLYNRAIKPRPPGSSIKPMGVYAPALQSGFDKAKSGATNGPSEGSSYGQIWTAASVIDDSPLTIQGKLWPKNWYSGYRGLYTMRQSLEQSVNVNAVKIFTNIGVETSLKSLKNFGISSIVESGNVNDMNAAALALGGMSHGISPLEMAAGYGTFPNKGSYTEPIAYTKVTNKRGDVILEKVPAKAQIIDEGVAFIMTDMLRTVVTNGIGNSAAIGSQPVGGKTGTTSNNYDAWFVGFTPQYAASIWIGNDINVELSQGSASAARLWSKIMKQVVAGIDAGSFPSKPDNVISVAIDTKSGRLPSDLSALDPRRDNIRNEYFIKGTEPTTTDNVHVAASVCADSGYLATPYCSNVVSKVYVKRPYTANPSVGDYSYELPGYYCNLHNPDVSKYPINPKETLNPGGGGSSGGGITAPDGTVNNPGNNNGGSPDDGNKPPDWFN
jgi:penicillin-binding protein 1A